MPIYQLQVRMWDLDSSLPRDAAINTVYFNDHGVTSDPDGLCGDVADMYLTNLTRTVPIEVTAYDMADTKPRVPKGHAVRNVGVSGTPGGVPREVAITLSFYAGTNRPRNRGRIFLPVYLMGLGGIGQRPTSGQIDRALAWAVTPDASLPDIGGVDVEWCVWSETDQQAKPVTAGWVDDEWDTIRSRGLRSTTRTTFTRQG
jgi:hypothetical protein